MTSITTQKSEKCDWSVKRDFCDKNSAQNTKKLQIRYFLSGIRFYLKIIIKETKIEN